MTMSVRFSDTDVALRAVSSGVVNLNKTIQDWIELCNSRSYIHGVKASYLRVYTAILTILGIGSGGASSVISALMSQSMMGNEYTVWASSLSAFALAMHAINNIVDPGVLRLNHLTACRDYDLLSRDIDMWHKTHKKQTDDFDTLRIECMRFQRRIDNIQSVAPSL